MAGAKKFTGVIDLSAATDAVVRKDSGVDLSPYKERLQQSWNKKAAGHQAPGFEFTVPTEAVASLMSRFRQAAKELDLGVAFSQHAREDGTTAVSVEARTKKTMPPRASNGAARPATGLPKPAKAGK